MRSDPAFPALVARFHADGESDAPRAAGADTLADDLRDSGLGHVVSEPVLRILAAMVTTLVEADQDRAASE